jgi:Uma2 family endonuclease
MYHTGIRLACQAGTPIDKRRQCLLFRERSGLVAWSKIPMSTLKPALDICYDVIMITLPPQKPRFYYPESDGEPMAENTLQFEWIVTLQGNLDLLFRDNPDVFVAGDHLIYPLDKNREIRQAPDVYVAFGRPKGHRGSYAVSEEGGIFPQVIFEVWSPGNRMQQMDAKREFYEKYGAEEYYLIYPEQPAYIEGWQQMNGKLVAIEEMNGFVSPLLRIRFELHEGQLVVHHPDGKQFLSFVELGTYADQEHTRAIAEQQRAETAEQHAAKLAARLRELGIDPDKV